MLFTISQIINSTKTKTIAHVCRKEQKNRLIHVIQLFMKNNPTRSVRNWLDLSIYHVIYYCQSAPSGSMFYILNINKCNQSLFKPRSSLYSYTEGFSCKYHQLTDLYHCSQASVSIRVAQVSEWTQRWFSIRGLQSDQVKLSTMVIYNMCTLEGCRCRLTMAAQMYDFRSTWSYFICYLVLG